MAMAATISGQVPVQVWEKLLLTIGEGFDQGIYTCRVMDILEDRLLVTRPVYEYGNSLLADHRMVTASFTRTDAAYAFSGRIHETEPKSDDAMHLFGLSKVMRIQRRRFVRLDIGVPIKYCAVPRPLVSPLDLAACAYEPSCTINLSAGGILFPVNGTPMAADMLIIGTYDHHLKKLPDYLFGTVRQIRRMDDNRRVCGVEFVLKEYLDRYLNCQEMEMVPEEINVYTVRRQNELASELFTQQLLMRQKGIL